MPRPTKILKYDLEKSLRKVFDELEILKAEMGQTKLDELFKNINIDMLAEDEARIMQDLLNGYEDSNVLTIPRIKEIEEKIEELKNVLSIDVAESAKFEEFSYDEDQDVKIVAVYDKADNATRVKLYETEYQYNTVNENKEIVKSISKIFNEDITVNQTITKLYNYDSNNNVKSITTTVE